MYQSQQDEAYLRVLATLRQRGLSYYCNYARSRIQSFGGHYDGYCRDGLFTYNLAVAMNDTALRVTEVVRASDLIAPKVHQLALYRQLGYKEPGYVHLLLALSPAELKLSKKITRCR